MFFVIIANKGAMRCYVSHPDLQKQGGWLFCGRYYNRIIEETESLEKQIYWKNQVQLSVGAGADSTQSLAGGS